ncbi:MAG: hypothetical protein KC609_23300, partial [Myxococcales bacterium]|nr:hypothetical protein [Myxococcales bacterium]
MALTATRGPRSTRIYRSNTPAGPLQLTLRKGSQNLMLDHGRVVLTADAEGRPFTLWRAQTLWRRGYDGRCQVISRGDEWQRRRAVLAGDEFLVEWRRAVSGLGDTLGAIEDTDDRARLASMLEPDELRLAAEAQRYRGLYRGLGILPPDAYLAAVVQLVEGCPYNRCTFCTFYRHRRYRIRRIDELERHARAVKAFLGRALEMRRSVFLADADALSAPDAVLLATLDRCRRIFDERPVDAFASSFTRKGRT